MTDEETPKTIDWDLVDAVEALFGNFDTELTPDWVKRMRGWEE